MRSRGELLRLSLLHAALADALKAELKTRFVDAYEKAHEFESVRTNAGEAYATQTQPRGVVKDTEALADFLEQHTGLTIRREVREVSPSGLEAFLADQLTPMVWEHYDENGSVVNPHLRPATEEELAEPGREFEVQDKHGRPVPGVVWFTGGTLYNITVKGAKPLEARYRKLAKQYATGAVDADILPW